MPREKSPRTAAPKLPRFSPTRINLYLYCPRAYYFYYHRRLRWGRLTAGQAVGGHLHRALQVFHDRGGIDQVSLDELVGELRERWSESGFASAEEAAAHLESGEAILRNYYVNAATEAQPGRETLWTEKTVQHRYDDFVLFGKIDRLDRLPDGTLEVVDYKSGRWSVTEEEVRESLALRIYQLLVARENPEQRVSVGIRCLRSGACAFVTRTAEELAQVEQEVQEIVRRILTDTEMAPIPGEQCRECVYPRICPPGRLWLARHGLQEDG